MDRNRDYGVRGGGIPGGVKSFDPWQRGGSDRGPPEPRSSSDRRSRERHVPVDFRDFPSSTHNRSPPRPHRRSRSPDRDPASMEFHPKKPLKVTETEEVKVSHPRNLDSHQRLNQLQLTSDVCLTIILVFWWFLRKLPIDFVTLNWMT